MAARWRYPERVASSRASDEAKAYLRVTYHLSHSLETVSQESDAFNFDINADQMQLVIDAVAELPKGAVRLRRGVGRRGGLSS